MKKESENMYLSPFSERYTSPEMLSIFSEDEKFKTWRLLWLYLAECEKELGINITSEQILELKKNVTNINYDVAKKREMLVHHDVMAHVYAYGQQCPKASPIIHLGATSCYVCDNTDVILMSRALKLVRRKLYYLLESLCNFCDQYKSLPTVAYTHFQPAQLTTVGKRASLWANELLSDFCDIDFRLSKIKLLGCKGATGTQASFVSLFNGDFEKVKKLEQMIIGKLGFKEAVIVSGQTYSRKLDYQILSVLSGVSQSLSKMATDIRLLQGLGEIAEPFSDAQIGSSAMPYKKNPMKCERICSLARFVIAATLNPALTASSQWLERSLDDSANRRIVIPESFFAIDGMLNISLEVVDGLKISHNEIEKNVSKHLPKVVSENLMMKFVLEGGNRQELHEEFRRYFNDDKMVDMELFASSYHPNDFCSEEKDNMINAVQNESTTPFSTSSFNLNELVGIAPMQVTSFVEMCREILRSSISIDEDLDSNN